MVSGGSAVGELDPMEVVVQRGFYRCCGLSLILVYRRSPLSESSLSGVGVILWVVRKQLLVKSVVDAMLSSPVTDPSAVSSYVPVPPHPWNLHQVRNFFTDLVSVECVTLLMSAYNITCYIITVQ
jgi:hypothetical protein